MEEELDTAGYEISLPVFEGPMDLLLHLVTKNRIDIHDIPIHEITDQYLAYLEKAREFDLNLGSSFFAMAATLLLIKSRILLPRKRQEETDEAEDPRQELARSLEEFRRMKEMRRMLEELLEKERPYRMREPSEPMMGFFRRQKTRMALAVALVALLELVRTGEVVLEERAGGFMVRAAEGRIRSGET